MFPSRIHYVRTGQTHGSAAIWGRSGTTKGRSGRAICFVHLIEFPFTFSLPRVAIVSKGVRSLLSDIRAYRIRSAAAIFRRRKIAPPICWRRKLPLTRILRLYRGINISGLEFHSKLLFVSLFYGRAQKRTGRQTTATSAAQVSNAQLKRIHTPSVIWNLYSTQRSKHLVCDAVYRYNPHEMCVVMAMTLNGTAQLFCLLLFILLVVCFLCVFFLLFFSFG